MVLFFSFSILLNGKKPKAQEGKPANLLKLKWSTLRRIPYFWSPVHLKPIRPRANHPDLLCIATHSPFLLCLTPGSPNPRMVPGSRAGHHSKWQQGNGSLRCRVPWVQIGSDKRLFAFSFLLSRWIFFFSFGTSVLLIRFMWVCISLHLCISH